MRVIVIMLVIFSGELVTIMRHDTAIKTVCGLCLMKPKSIENISQEMQFSMILKCETYMFFGRT